MHQQQREGVFRSCRPTSTSQRLLSMCPRGSHHPGTVPRGDMHRGARAPRPHAGGSAGAKASDSHAFSRSLWRQGGTWCPARRWKSAPRTPHGQRQKAQSPGVAAMDPAELPSLGHHIPCPGHGGGRALLPPRRQWPCPGETSHADVPPRAPREKERPPRRIHMETAYFGGAIRLTMELQGYAAMQPGAEFTLFTISPAKQQSPCSQNPGWTLI